MPPIPPKSDDPFTCLPTDWAARRVILTVKWRNETENLLCVPKAALFGEAPAPHTRVGVEWLLYVFDIDNRADRVVPMRHITAWRSLGASAVP